MFSFLPTMLLPSNDIKKSVNDEQSTLPADVLMADYIMGKNQRALVALYKQFADDLYHYLLTLSDHTLAKDIAQKTWLKVIENPHNYHTSGSVKAWLFTIARNALIDEYRKTNRWRELNESVLNPNNDMSQYMGETGNAPLDCQLSTDKLEQAFDKALMQLSFEQREAFCLQQEGFSLHDIAQMTKNNKETIKTRLRYARHKLKQLLESSYE